MENIMVSVVTGIVSSLLTTYILEKRDKNKAKRILLKNVRFMESIEESFLFIMIFLENSQPIFKYYAGIDWFNFPGKIEKTNEIKMQKDPKIQKNFINFCKTNKGAINMMVDMIKFKRSDIIYDVIDKSIAIYYSHRLYEISNNLMNRTYNFVYDRNNDYVDNLINKHDAISLHSLIFDIFAYISYIFDLYDYLGIKNSTLQKYKENKRVYDSLKIS